MLRLALASLFVLFPILASAQPDGCPDEVVYGDPAHPNVLEYTRDGQVRRLHFENAAVWEGRGTRISVYLPAVHRRPGSSAWLNAHPDAEPDYGAMSMLLDLDPEGTFSSNRLNVRFRQMPTLDCFDRTLGELLDSGAQEVTVAREGDHLVLHATAQRDDATLRLAVRTAQRLTRPTIDASLAGEGTREVEAYLDPERHVVHVVRWPNVMTVPLPAEGRRVARELREGVEVIEFVSLEDGLLVLDMHRVAETGETSIIRQPAMLGLDLASVELTDATRTERSVGPLVERRLPPLVVTTAEENEAAIPPFLWSAQPATAASPTVRAPAAHRLVGTDSDGAVALVLADTLVGGTPALGWHVTSFDLGAASLDALTQTELDALRSYFLTTRALHEGEIETEEAVAEAFRPAFESLGRWEEVEAFVAETPANPYAEALPIVEAAVAPDATEADIEAALAVLSELGMAPEPYDLGPPDFNATDPARDERERLIRWIRSTPLIEMRYQVNHGRPPLFDAIEMAMTNHFGPLTIYAYWTRLAADDPTIEGVPMQRPPMQHGPRVVLDAVTLRPVSRTETARVPGPGLDLTYTMDYAAGHLSARNEHQGEDTQPLPLPEGTLDAATFLNTIPFLDLSAPQTLYLVDFAPTQSAGYSSGEGSYQRAHLIPEATRVRLEPQGTAEDGPEGVPALRVRLFPEGSPSFLLGMRPRTLPTDDEGRPFAELLVRAEAPHYPLALTAGRDALRFWGVAEGESLPPEGLAWLNAMIDPRGGP